MALERRAEASIAQGEHALVVPELEQLAADHPARERLLSLLMTALYRCDRQADALAAYDRGRRRLDEELGLQPSPQLQQLQAMILRQDATLEAPVRPTNLPPGPGPLIGREAELDAVAALLTGEARLVTIVGLGGTGKTRLAAAAGERLLSAFAGGVWLVALAGVHEPDALTAEIAAALGVADDDRTPPDVALARRLDARPTLLVLDNFEQLVDAAPAVHALLERSPPTRVLVTSQLPLRLSRERVLRLPPLDREHAVLLFEQRARAAAPDFELAPHRAAVEAICVSVDGMPLAIELAAARVATIAPDDLLDRMTRSLDVLARGPRDLAERHRSIRATLDWTYELLDEDERTLLARLAAFSGPAPLEAVEAIAAPLDTLDALSGLVDASLVRRDDGVRYTLPQAVRDFAAEHLRASGEEDEVRRAHGAYLASLGEACRGVGDSDAVRGRVLALAAEQRPALTWAREHDPELHARLTLALAVVMVDFGRMRTAHEELGVVRSRTDPSTPAWGKAALLGAYATAGTGRAEEETAQLVERGLALIRAAGDDDQLWFALMLADKWKALNGDMAGALELSVEMLDNARSRGHTGDLAASLVALAHTLVHLGRLDEVEPLLGEAEQLLPLVGDSALDPSDIRGDVAAARGDWGRAAAMYARYALSVTQLPGELAWDLRRAAVACAHHGADEEALEIEAATNGILDEIDEGLDDFWMATYGAELTAARERLPPDRAEEAVRRGRELTARAAAERAVELTERLWTPSNR